MKRCLFLVVPILMIMLLGDAGRAELTNSRIETQVLRIFATKRAGYYHKPWKSPDFIQVKGSAFFFSDEKLFPGQRGLILTNAHAVALAQSIKISNGKEKRRYDVNLVGVCNTADFAVVKMEAGELEIYERRNGKVVPLQLGNSDQLRVGHKVLGWGYPLGGERISKSEEGEISRIEVNRYAYSGDRWLMVQASLQQNRGNSGGPVLKDGHVVGMSFQGIRTSDRINYFIPINLVRRLVPALGDQSRIPQWQYLAQSMFPRLKDYYNLDADQGGILIDYVIPGGGPQKFGLRDGDILVEIDGHEIDNFGDIFYEPIGQRVYYEEILNRKLVGDPLSLKVIRKGEVKEISGSVGEGLPVLVPRIFAPPNYFIFGGIGFVELTLNCIDNLGKSGEAFRAKYASEYPQKPYQKIIIISEIFPEYGLVNTVPFLKRIEKINGEEVLNISDLYQKLQTLKEQGKKKAILETAGHILLPLDIDSADKLDAGIKEKYGILYMKTPGDFQN